MPAVTSLPSVHIRPQGSQRRSLVCCATAHSEAPPADAQTRRGLLLTAAAAVLAGVQQQPAAQASEPVPAAPALGDCPECIGEVNETLNACPLASQSCISTLNDDEAHFVAPWQFDLDRDAAIAQLVDVATGGKYEPGLIDTFGGISQTDAAAYIAKGVLAVATGGTLPEQPKRKRKEESEIQPFDGIVIDRHTTAGGAEYIRLTLGTAGGSASEVDDPSQVIDCEFLFLPNDNIVNVRASSRVDPQGGLGRGGELALSFTDGLIFDRNKARKKLEALRMALRWELATVITDFDPRFNAEAPTILDRAFDPFNRRQFQPSGEAYPADLE